MKVYVLCEVEQEGSEILGVFSSVESAKAAVADKVKPGSEWWAPSWGGLRADHVNYFYVLDITEHEVQP